MVKKTENKKKVWNLSVKLNVPQSEQIAELIKKNELNYRNKGSVFVEKAVEKEIHLANIKLGLSKAGKFYFDMVYHIAVVDAYDKAKNFEQNYSTDSEKFKRNLELSKIKEKEDNYKI